MFSVYGVRVVDGEKDRRFVGSFEHEMHAKHAANVATCRWAEYAYVKEFGQGTIFFIRSPDSPDYDEQPIDPLRLRPQPRPSQRV